MLAVTVVKWKMAVALLDAVELGCERSKRGMVGGSCIERVPNSPAHEDKAWVSSGDRHIDLVAELRVVAIALYDACSFAQRVADTRMAIAS